MNRKSTQLALLLTAVSIFGLALRKVSRRRDRLDFSGRSVVITGGSRGLGLVLARLLAKEGARLALLARNSEELERARQELAAQGTDVMTIECNVGNRVEVEGALARVEQRYGQIDVLINNAGIVQVDPIEHMTLRDFQNALDVHFWGPFYAVQAVLPRMRQRGGGRIVNIASIGGLVAVPHLAPYSASKFALVGLSDSLRAELAKEGIYVTTVAPGLMRTGSHIHALFKGRHRQEYTWFSIMDALPLTSTSTVSAAHQIVKACRYGAPYLVITPQARLLVLFNSFFPGVLAGVMKLTNRLLPQPEPRWGDVAKRGLDSQSRWSPSKLTILADRAVFDNNQLAGVPEADQRGSLGS